MGAGGKVLRGGGAVEFRRPGVAARARKAGLMKRMTQDRRARTSLHPPFGHLTSAAGDVGDGFQRKSLIVRYS
jgi:hypothetical protein